MKRVDIEILGIYFARRATNERYRVTRIQWRRGPKYSRDHAEWKRVAADMIATYLLWCGASYRPVNNTIAVIVSITGVETCD